MTEPRGGGRPNAPYGAGGRVPRQPDDDELFSDEELSWEDDAVPPAGGESAPGWPVRERRPAAPPPEPYARRRLFALAGLVALVVVAIVVAVALSGGEETPDVPTVATTVENPPAQTTTATETTAAPPSVTLADGEPLEHGDSGAAVRRLQQALEQLGFEVGEVDGAFGDATRMAVMRFQEQNGLAADGVVGSRTAAALNDALAR